MGTKRAANLSVGGAGRRFLGPELGGGLLSSFPAPPKCCHLAPSGGRGSLGPSLGPGPGAQKEGPSSGPSPPTLPRRWGVGGWGDRKAGRSVCCPPGLFALFYNRHGSKAGELSAVPAQSPGGQLCLSPIPVWVEPRAEERSWKSSPLPQAIELHPAPNRGTKGPHLSVHRQGTQRLHSPAQPVPRPPAPSAPQPFSLDPYPPHPDRLTLITVAPGKAWAAPPLQCRHRAVGHSVCGSDQSPVTNTRAASGECECPTRPPALLGSASGPWEPPG